MNPNNSDRKSKKTAIVLLNLGGPDAPESVQPFLFNLFNDKAIIGLPQPFRWLLAKLISSRRGPEAAEIYSHIGGKSPLLELTHAQADALGNKLSIEGDDSFEIFVCMRYWHPMTAEVVAKVKESGADEVVLLPLYPQFSTTTSGSSFNEWDKEAKRQGLDIATAKIGCYFVQDDFIAAHAKSIVKTYEQASQHGPARILFSAHGLPQKIVDAGDPYQWQIEQTVAAIVALNPQLGASDHVTCYQSKVGPLQWLTPSTETEIARAAKDGVPIVIVPIAFVSEHSETLVELDIEYRELAEEQGVEHYYRVPALGVDEDYITALAKLCNLAVMGKTCAHDKKRHCPKGFSKCVCEDVSLAS